MVEGRGEGRLTFGLSQDVLHSVEDPTDPVYCVLAGLQAEPDRASRGPGSMDLSWEVRALSLVKMGRLRSSYSMKRGRARGGWGRAVGGSSLDGGGLVRLEFLAVLKDQVFEVPVEKTGDNGEGFVGAGGEDVGTFVELGAGGDIVDIAFGHRPL